MPTTLLLTLASLFTSSFHYSTLAIIIHYISFLIVSSIYVLTNFSIIAIFNFSNSIIIIHYQLRYRTSYCTSC